MLLPQCWDDLGVGMTLASGEPGAGSPTPERVQLCGTLVFERDGERLESRLPGRQGRLLFSYLVLHRHRACSRDELTHALWGERVPAAKDAGLNALISKVRKGLGPQLVQGRTTTRLALSPDAWVDVEVAERAAHKAESRVALSDWAHAWGPSLAALFIAERTLLPGEDAPWIEEERQRLADVRLRALEAYGLAALGLGGTELSAAVRVGRQLVRLAPLRETGYQTLMQALAAQGNVAEALNVHAHLSRTLRDELGVSPCVASQAVYESLLHR
jgi:DNA-binding SARP family transcriptional activator